MSDLTAFRDHARRMATAEHKPECKTLRVHLPWFEWIDGRWVDVEKPAACPGCNPAKDRELFARLADEVDAYLGRDEVVDLFRETAVEPERGGPVPLSQCVAEVAVKIDREVQD